MVVLDEGHSFHGIDELHCMTGSCERHVRIWCATVRAFCLALVLVSVQQWPDGGRREEALENGVQIGTTRLWGFEK